MKKRFSAGTVVGLVLLVSVLTFVVTYLSVFEVLNQQLMEKNETDDALDKITLVLDHLEESFIGEFERETLVDGALKGMVAATGDRWSAYLTGDEYDYLMQNIMNEYVGIGLSVSYNRPEEGILVVRAHPGSSAEEMGFEKGDLIVAVGAMRIGTYTQYELADAISGPEGTTVTLGVVRAATGEEETLEVERRSYTYQAVFSEIMDGNVGYVRVENFDSLVHVNFKDAVNQLIDAGVEGFIFDVRFNPGGQLAVLQKMLDQLLPKGRIFLSRDKAGNEYELTSGASCVEMPMVVLVNEDSVSAAEYFAAALQEYDWAEIVGMNTTGKGYSQVQIPLGDGSALNLSVNEYFTPQGRSLIGVGITPDYIVDLSDEDYINWSLLEHDEDEQLTMARTVIANAIEAARPQPEEDVDAAE
ncbi:PDZ domain-containing protein [Oscillospiraceae bacterium OttesenSCG-928-F05]|nr:PDZ domain-containing protein [Oscillospiraceae bacterium OttesenSCG-928-F05]